MEELLKGCFEDIGKSLKTPPVLELVAIILFIFKITLSQEYIDLTKNFANDFDKMKFVINLIPFICIMLFITSIVAFIAALIFLIIYPIFDKIDNKIRFSIKWVTNLTLSLQRFCIGSITASINVDVWLLVSSSYLYIFNENYFCRYEKIILNHFIQANRIIIFLAALYILMLFISLIQLLIRMIHKFLYFQLNEETQKKFVPKKD